MLSIATRISVAMGKLEHGGEAEVIKLPETNTAFVNIGLVKMKAVFSTVDFQVLCLVLGRECF